MALDIDSGRLPRDSAGKHMQAPWRFTTAYNQKFPKTVSTVEQFIDIPPDCIALVLRASAADLRVAFGAGGTAAGGAYDVLFNGTSDSYPVAGMERVYLLRDASTDVVVRGAFWLIGD